MQWLGRWEKRRCMYDAHTINCNLRAHKDRKIPKTHTARNGRASTRPSKVHSFSWRCIPLGRRHMGTAACAHAARLLGRATSDRVCRPVHAVRPRRPAVQFIRPLMAAGVDCNAKSVSINPHSAVRGTGGSARDSLSSSRLRCRPALLIRRHTLQAV